MNQYLKSVRINSKGLGVAEALVGAAITVIVMMGFATYMVNAQRQQRQLMMKMDQKDLQTLLLSANSALAIPAKCQNNLNSIVGTKPIGALWPAEKTAGGVWAIKEYKSNGAVIGDIINSTGFVKGSNSLKVKSLKIKGLNNLLPNVGSTANVELIIDVQSSDASAMKIKPIEITTSVSTAIVGANLILSSCKAEGAAGAAAAVEESLVWRYGPETAGEWINIDISGKNLRAILIKATAGGGGGSGGNGGHPDQWRGTAFGSGGGAGGYIDDVVFLPVGTTAIKIFIGKGGAGGGKGWARVTEGCPGNIPTLAAKDGQDTIIKAIPSNTILATLKGGEGSGSPANLARTNFCSLSARRGCRGDGDVQIVGGPFGGVGALDRWLVYPGKGGSGEDGVDGLCTKYNGGQQAGRGGGNGGGAGGTNVPGNLMQGNDAFSRGQDGTPGTGGGGGGGWALQGGCWDGGAWCRWPGGAGANGSVSIVGFK